jgi:hypothetical protein
MEWADEMELQRALEWLRENGGGFVVRDEAGRWRVGGKPRPNGGQAYYEVLSNGDTYRWLGTAGSFERV